VGTNREINCSTSTTDTVIENPARINKVVSANVLTSADRIIIYVINVTTRTIILCWNDININLIQRTDHFKYFMYYPVEGKNTLRRTNVWR